MLTAVLSACVLFVSCSKIETEKYNDMEIIIGSTSSEKEQSDPAESDETCESAEYTDTETVTTRAQLILSELTLREKIGQMILATCPVEGAASQASEYDLGGYLLFAYHFRDETPESVRMMIGSFQEASDIPMLVAVDEEGGDIVRLSKFPQYADEPFGAPMELYSSGGVKAVLDDARAKCSLLAELGVNMNLAPVCDIPRSEHDYIYDRTFGTDCNIVCECIEALIREMNSYGMISALKHFPGYGNNLDTHTGIATDERTLEEFREIDLRPFASGIDAAAPCIMVSHNIVKCMDESLPASLSPEVHRLLREELGFDGVIMTDELTMGAIREFTGGEDPAVAAVKAGNDLLCIADYAEAIDAVEAAVVSGEISEEQINASVLRILDMKIGYGLIG